MRSLKRTVLTLVAIALSVGTSAAMAQVQVLAAWYGVEGGTVAAAVRGQPILPKLQAAAASGALMVPANMNEYFGGDPYPGQKKTLAVQVNYNGAVYNLRQAEGTSLVFPGTPGKTYLFAPVDAPVEVTAAWYGLDGVPQPDKGAVGKIRSNMMAGNVYVPADMNAFFGYDNAVGKVKRVAVNAKYKGVTYNLRQIEGRALLFPGTEGVDYLIYADSQPPAAIRPYFNHKFYALRYPDLMEAFGPDNEGALWNHYLTFGTKEGRDPNSNVNMAALRMRYPLLRDLYGDDNQGFLNAWVQTGGTNSKYNADPAATNFVDKGVFMNEKLAYFDAQYYFKVNPAVCGNPALTIPKGATNGCSGGASPDFPALQEHFLTVGSAQGLKSNNFPSGPPQSANGKEIMRAGDWLSVNQYLVSRNGGNIAVLQSNGDFAVYRTDNPSKVTAGNYAGLHTGIDRPNSERGDGYFITMQGDGHLCTYRGTNPGNNKGFIGCTGPVLDKSVPLYLKLQSDTNLVIRFGTTVFDDQGYLYDFRTNVPPKKGFFGSVISTIRTAVGCK